MLCATLFVTGAALLLSVHGAPLERHARTGYVDYRPSSGLNVILSGGHGGAEEPSSIPDRDAGCWDGNECIWSHSCGSKDFDRCDATTVTDMYTAELTLELYQAMCDRFGACPAAVVNLLDRIKLDPNREIDEATFGEQLAIDVYNEYHGYIQQERSSMVGAGLYLDIHGHGHSIVRAELGYLVSGSDLDSGDPIDPDTTSIRAVAARVGGDFDVLLRSGADSFGGLMEAEGYRAVPSPADPGPDGNSYFSGGYSTRVHGSVDGGVIDGIQIESPRDYREMPERASYVTALVNTVENYLAAHYP